MSETVTLQSSTLTELEVRAITTFYQAFTDHHPDLVDGSVRQIGKTSHSLPAKAPGQTVSKSRSPPFSSRRFPTSGAWCMRSSVLSGGPE